MSDNILKILKYPHPKLKAKAKPIEHIDDKINKLAYDMLNTMHKADGIGLAAPQVGILKRLIVIGVPEQPKNTPNILINPQEHKTFQWIAPRDALTLNLIQDLDLCIKLFFDL